MREGSREQAGCFISVLMLASALFLFKAVMRNVVFQPWRPEASRVEAAAPGLLVLAAAFVVLALFGFQLRRWALAAYWILSLIGVGVAVFADLGGLVIAALVIAPSTSLAVAIARRDLL